MTDTGNATNLASMLSPPRRVTVVESIIEQLVALIGEGTLTPGDRLPSERQLMEMLGVSRASVREALQGLAAMGLVQGRAGEGTFVTRRKPPFAPGMDITALSSTLQKDMRHHLNEARLSVELEIVSLAAQRRSADDGTAIMAAVEAYDRGGVAASEDQGWPDHDLVHLTIAQATQNPIFVLLVQSLLDLVPGSLRNKGLHQGSSEVVCRRIHTEITIHRGLCEAVVRGDAEAARQWVAQHAEHERQIIEEYY